jgi:hypothetical protein
VACHEMSHQVGFGPEDEANFAGIFSGYRISKDRLLRYSAYQMAMTECMRALRRRDTVANNDLKTHISKAVKADIKKQRMYWMAYRGKIGLLSGVCFMTTI